MGAAEHGADFPMARKVRESMSIGQMHDFAAGSMKGKPTHAPRASSGAAPHPHRNLGNYLHPPKRRR